MESYNLRRRAKLIAKQSVMRNLVQVMGAVLACALPFMLTNSLVSNYLLSTGKAALPILLYMGSLILLVLPMLYGVMAFLSEILLVGNASILRVFDALTSVQIYLRSLRLGLCILLRTVLWLSIPFGVTAVYIYAVLNENPEMLANEQTFAMLLMQSVGLYSLVSIPFTARVICYLGAYPLMLRDPALGAWKATKQSVRILKGHWGKMIVFVVSFVGWQLFGVWTMGIGMLFYWGYLLAAFLIYFQIVEQGEGIPSQPMQ